MQRYPVTINTDPERNIVRAHIITGKAKGGVFISILELMHLYFRFRKGSEFFLAIEFMMTTDEALGANNKKF